MKYLASSIRMKIHRSILIIRGLYDSLDFFGESIDGGDLLVCLVEP